MSTVVILVVPAWTTRENGQGLRRGRGERETVRLRAITQAEEAHLIVTTGRTIAEEQTSARTRGLIGSESEVDGIALAFKVVGRATTSLVFGLIRGDSSVKAVKSATTKVISR
jgi:predicted acyltransferase (DUF342 family)